MVVPVRFGAIVTASGPFTNPPTPATTADADNGVVGAVDTTNTVVLVILITVVPGANAPVPEVTLTFIPTTRFVVEPTVIVLPDDVAPAAEV